MVCDGDAGESPNFFLFLSESLVLRTIHMAYSELLRNLVALGTRLHDVRSPHVDVNAARPTTVVRPSILQLAPPSFRNCGILPSSLPCQAVEMQHPLPSDNRHSPSFFPNPTKSASLHLVACHRKSGFVSSPPASNVATHHAP